VARPHLPGQRPGKDYLYHYSRQFNTIELNTTHYRIPDAATITRWRTVASRGFTFCPKWPQQISHELGLQYAEAPTKAFCDSIRGLAEHLGASFLQLPPYFTPRQADVLVNFLENVPEEIPVAVEFRHEDWFRPSAVVEETFWQMEQMGISTVLTDVAGRRDALHMHLTTPTAMVRFVGNGLHPSDYRRIEDWTERLGAWFTGACKPCTFSCTSPTTCSLPTWPSTSSACSTGSTASTWPSRASARRPCRAACSDCPWVRAWWHSGTFLSIPKGSSPVEYHYRSPSTTTIWISKIKSY
jgi:uncharacterized protein YecE (DUF72 family)